MDTQTISVEKLQKMLEQGSPVTILDIRPQEQRDEWRIAESMHQDAYHALTTGEDGALDRFEADPKIPVVTVCAAGRSSLLAADQLTSKGYTTYSLEGGMKAWNYAFNTAAVGDSDVKIIQVRRVAKGCLSYIIGSGAYAMVVDASLDPKMYIEIAEKYDWEIVAVADTHIHADYISRTRELAAFTGAKHYFTENADVEYPFLPLSEGQQIKIGEASIKVLSTPGHTPESISFLVDSDYLLTGDTLFIEGVGRPDLKADGDEAIAKATQLYCSLEKIRQLDQSGDLLILPAHTSSAIPFNHKIIAEKLDLLLKNVELLKLGQSSFVEQTIKRIPPCPPNYIQIAALNKSGKYDGINPADLEAGANRCAVS
jgi:glyoxylase-like metal-dependent hydrolase (beta-lactamase superfamily II)/rhodanese-related sulfurtransferase